MTYSVYLTDDAARDLEDLYDYISRNDAPEKATYVLDRIEEALTSLSESPNRGVYPRELIELGIKEYRQIFFKPFHIIYTIMEKMVYVVLITDGRRDMQALLQRRLIEA